MTGIIRNSVRILGTNGVNYGVVTGLQRNGSVSAKEQTAMDYLSYQRHLIGHPDTDTDTMMRPRRSEAGAAVAAPWAGRPGCRAGVLPHQNPARFAGRAIRFEWPGFGRVSASAFGIY